MICKVLKYFLIFVTIKSSSFNVQILNNYRRSKTRLSLNCYAVVFSHFTCSWILTVIKRGICFVIEVQRYAAMVANHLHNLEV